MGAKGEQHRYSIYLYMGMIYDPSSPFLTFDLHLLHELYLCNEGCILLLVCFSEPSRKERQRTSRSTSSTKNKTKQTIGKITSDQQNQEQQTEKVGSFKQHSAS